MSIQLHRILVAKILYQNAYRLYYKRVNRIDNRTVSGRNSQTLWTRTFVFHIPREKGTVSGTQIMGTVCDP
ncbi:hypothetical protein YC2023_105297 [Brassica napus]